MIHLFLNGLAASAGGGLTYLRNVLPQLSARADARATVALSPQLRRELGDLPNVSFLETPIRESSARRFWDEQTGLSRWVRESGAHALISTGNFALRQSPVPQILLSRNSLYISGDFFRDLRARHAYRLWLDTRIKGVLAKRSIRRADCTVAPTRAFAEDLRRWTGKDVTSIPHGFDHDSFFGDQTPLPQEIEQKLQRAPGALRLLFVSHYNYYRNFETLFRALPRILEGLGGRELKLFLTCTLRAEVTPGGYRPEQAASLIRRLGLTENVVELGAVPYSQLHHLYQSCDLYVTPAYTESFAHPLVEAMASGLPVIASDLPVHREICGPAGLYFPAFSAREIADQVLRVACSKALAGDLAAQGGSRAREFSWRRHVGQMIELATGLTTRRTTPAAI